MSTVTQPNQTSNFLQSDYDLSKIFIWNPRTTSGTFKNNTGGLASFLPGTIVARDNSDNSIVPFDSAVVANGAGVPIGVLMNEITDLADAGTLDDQNIVFSGDVNEDRIIFQNGGDTLDTVLGNGRSIGDDLRSKGIIPVVGDELSGTDNA